MKRIEANWLTNADTQRVFSVLMSAGHQAFVVGGCVRNALMDVPVSDIDIATSAKPEETMSLAKSAGLKAIPTGFDHGTVTIIAGKTPFEVTTFRHDVETDGRRAVVSFTDNMEEDARRRDFTMNALYSDASGIVLDPLGGLDDLLARRVRFIENANARIREDHLRSLRFFRFHAQYGDPSQGLDADAMAAIASNLDGLESLAAERIGAEMLKLLSAHDPAPALAGMAAAGALAVILPGSDPRWIAPLVHLEVEAGRAPNAMRRLAALGGEDPAGRLRLSRTDAKKHDQLGALARDTVRLREIAWKHGADVAWSVVLVRSALSDQPLLTGVAQEIERATTAKFPLKASDLTDHVTGPALGAALRRAESAWIEGDFQLSRGALAEIALKEG